MKRWMTVGVGVALPWRVWAHEGHGIPGVSHWHAADVLGFVAAIAVVAALIVWGGRGR